MSIATMRVDIARIAPELGNISPYTFDRRYSCCWELLSASANTSSGQFMRIYVYLLASIYTFSVHAPFLLCIHQALQRFNPYPDIDRHRQ